LYPSTTHTLVSVYNDSHGITSVAPLVASIFNICPCTTYLLAALHPTPHLRRLIHTRCPLGSISNSSSHPIPTLPYSPFTAQLRSHFLSHSPSPPWLAANGYSVEGFLNGRNYSQGYICVVFGACDSSPPTAEPKLIIFYSIYLPPRLALALYHQFSSSLTLSVLPPPAHSALIYASCTVPL
jgi:hypothetical protein